MRVIGPGVGVLVVSAAASFAQAPAPPVSPATSPSPSIAFATGRAGARLGLGWEYDLSGEREEFLLPDPVPNASVTPAHPLYVRVRAPWSLVEPEEGNYDWSEIDRIVEPYVAARHVVTLCLHGGNPAVASGSVPTSERTEALKAWLNMLRAAASHFKGRVRYYEVGRAPNLDPAWAGSGVREYAYVLKHSSVTIRSADPGALVAQGMLAIPDGGTVEALAWQKELYQQEIATYVDVLTARTPRPPEIGAVIGALYDMLLEHDPSAQIWAVEVAPAGVSERERAADLLRDFIEASGEGAALVSFDLEADVEGAPELTGLLLDVHRLFQPGFAPRGGRGVRIENSTGEPLASETVRTYELFDPATYQGLVAYFPLARPPASSVSLVLDTAAVKGVALYDLVGGAATPIQGARADFQGNTTDVPVPLRDRPLIVLYARIPIQGFEAEKERVSVRDTGIITVEEIMAGHQGLMADQDHRLENYRAAARITYHYKIAGSNTIDVAYDNAFFWQSGMGAEWQQTALYINGVRWKGKRFPDLPFIQPEKVLSLPLDIRLDRDYDYTYEGRDRVDGYDCHVVAFAPRDRARTLYEGKIWIESRTFAKVRMSVVQKGLVAPITSSEERSRYEPVAGPDGTTYWLQTRVDGQQVFTTGGRNLVVLREIEMRDFAINDPLFQEERERAYDSEAPILRDTDRGLLYLERGEDGRRTLEVEPARKTLFALGGLHAQAGFDYPVPLLGVNYFNYNVRGRDAQINAFLGGLVNLVTFTDPKLFGRVDGTVEALLFGIDLTDQMYVDGERREESDVDTQSQRLSAWLGLPLGSFFRISGGYDFEYVNYSRDEETDTFVVPSDTPLHTLGLQGEFNRAGWTVTASAGRSLRSRWEPWGDQSPPSPPVVASHPGSACDTPGSCLADFDDSQDTFRRYEYRLAKQFFLPAFQKIRFEASWLTGSRLDRFGEYSFSFYGERVRGFSGSGVRFDRGGVARVQYAFNVQDVVRFEATLDHGYVRDGLTSDRFGGFTGIGVSGNVLGPWQTLVSFDVGYSLAADVEQLRGSAEGQVVFFKFF